MGPFDFFLKAFRAAGHWAMAGFRGGGEEGGGCRAEGGATGGGPSDRELREASPWKRTRGWLKSDFAFCQGMLGLVHFLPTSGFSALNREKLSLWQGSRKQPRERSSTRNLWVVQWRASDGELACGQGLRGVCVIGAWLCRFLGLM